MAYSFVQTGNENVKMDILAFGLPGTKKTLSIGHLQEAGFNPFIVSCDPGGLVTLKNYQIPAVEINSINDAIDFIKDVHSGKVDLRQFGFLCLDGMTNLSYMCLKATGECAKDRRLDYSNYWIAFRRILDELRRLPFHFYANALCAENNNGIVSPMIEGGKYSTSMTGTFNTVLGMRRFQTQQNAPSEVFIQTFDDGVYNCKDRTNSCNNYEQSLSDVVIKILSKKGN